MSNYDNILGPEARATLASTSLEHYGEKDLDISIYDKFLEPGIGNNFRKMHGFPKFPYVKLRRIRHGRRS